MREQARRFAFFGLYDLGASLFEGNAGRVQLFSTRISSANTRIAVALVLAFVSLNVLVIVGGRSRIPSAPTLSTGGMRSLLPYGYNFKAPADSIENDMGGAFNASYNYDRFLGHSLRQGSIPLWDPNLGFGMAHLGNGLSAVLYPFNWLHAVVPPKLSDIVLFLNWWLAAWFLTRFLLQIGLDHLSAAAGGLIILCAGWFSAWLGLREITGVAAWFPFLLYAIQRTSVQPLWPWKYPALGFGVFCTITAGHPEAFIPSLLVLAVYGLFATAYAQNRWQCFLNLFAGSAIGIALSAPAWLTFIETIGLSHQPHQTWTFPAGELSVNPHGFFNFIFPSLFGVIHQNSFLSLVGGEYTAPGWLPPIAGFFFVAGLFGSRSRYVWFFGTLFFLVALKVYGAPPFQLVAKLPVFKEIIWPRYGSYLMTFSVAIVSAVGAANIWHGLINLRKVVGLWCFLVLIAVVELSYQIAVSHVAAWPTASAALAVAALWAIVPPLSLLAIRGARGIGWRVVLAGALGLTLPAAAYDTGGFLWSQVIAISAIYLLVFITSAILLARHNFGPVTSVATAVFAVALPVTIFAGVTGYGPPHRYDVLTKPPYIEKLIQVQQGGLYRHFPLDAAPMPNVETALGLPGLSWIVPTVPEGFYQFFRRFLDSTLQVPNWYATNVSLSGPMASADELHRNNRFFSLAGVRYITTQGTLVMSQAGELNEIFPSDASGTMIVENPKALPRLFLIAKVRNVETQAAAWDLLANFENPAVEAAAEGVAIDGTCTDQALTLSDFAIYPNSVTVTVDARCPGMLVLSDQYFPGWHVSVDGVDKKLYRVDGIYRGVQLTQPGEFAIRFWYRPQSWLASCALAIAGGMVLLIMFWFTQRERQEPPVQRSGPTAGRPAAGQA